MIGRLLASSNHGETVCWRRPVSNASWRALTASLPVKRATIFCLNARENGFVTAGSEKSDQAFSGNSDHLPVALPGQIVGELPSDEGKDDRHAQATRDSSPPARGAHVERDRGAQR